MHQAIRGKPPGRTRSGWRLSGLDSGSFALLYQLAVRGVGEAFVRMLHPTTFPGKS